MIRDWRRGLVVGGVTSPRESDENRDHDENESRHWRTSAGERERFDQAAPAAGTAGPLAE